ncbi:hypothetical protein KKG41_00460 [Patescibacteria group bacterium]|nr:hypothetical protein [Patescibacteria group bacterium]MBU1890896.1 hypothetical protein [Patescibacteria group bacterium]
MRDESFVEYAADEFLVRRMMTVSKRKALITSGQSKQIKRFGSDAVESGLEEAGLDKDGVQRVIKRGDDLKAAIKAATITALKGLSVSNQFAGEEVQSDRTYPSEYTGPKPIREQIGALAEIFDLDPEPHLSSPRICPSLQTVPKAGSPCPGMMRSLPSTTKRSRLP